MKKVEEKGKTRQRKERREQSKVRGKGTFFLFPLMTEAKVIFMYSFALHVLYSC